MLPKAVSTLFLCFLVACVSLSGCSSGHSRAWVDDKVSFGGYKAFEINPVFNATREGLNEDIPVALTALLKAQFADRQLRIANASQADDSILIVRSRIVVYEGCRRMDRTATPGLATPGFTSRDALMGQSMCTVQTQLVDKSTGRIIAEIFTTKVVGACFTHQYEGQWLLQEAAIDIAKKVAEIMASKQPA